MKNIPEQNPNKENNLEQIAKEIFDNWNQSLRYEEGDDLEKKAEVVASNYLEDGELFGTVSKLIRHGRSEIAGYFKHFLESKPKGEIIEVNVIELDESTILQEGLYNFTLVKDSREKVVKARFTFVYQKDNNGEWKILHHHSAVENDRNKVLNNNREVFDLDDEDLLLQPEEDTKDRVQKGRDKQIGSYRLRTGFYTNDSGLVRRFTYLFKNDKVVCQQISELPAGFEGEIEKIK